MNKKTYSGAYFRRRYSNASSTSLGNSTHSSAGGNGGGSTVNIVLSVNNASMGSINATLLPSANQNHQQGEVVINRDGTIVKRFAPVAEPVSFEKDIEAML